MRRTISIVAVVAGLAIAAQLAVVSPAGAAGVCTVTPDPVTLGVDQYYIVTATGGLSGGLYEVDLPDPGGRGHHNTDESRVWLGYADESGVVTAVIGVDDGRVVGEGSSLSLWPGTATVKVQRYRTGGGSPGIGSVLLASCSFEVVG